MREGNILKLDKFYYKTKQQKLNQLEGLRLCKTLVVWMLMKYSSKKNKNKTVGLMCMKRQHGHSFENKENGWSRQAALKLKSTPARVKTPVSTALYPHYADKLYL